MGASRPGHAARIDACETRRAGATAAHLPPVATRAAATAARSDAPLLDGDTSDRVWRNIRPFTVMSHHGGNFDGKGETRIDIRAVHDGAWAYFLFTWDDPTRSLKHLPLIKEADGWHLLHNG